MLGSWAKRGEEIAKRKHTPEEIINKLREAEVVVAAVHLLAALDSSTVAEASRRIGVSEQTIYTGGGPDGTRTLGAHQGERHQVPFHVLWSRCPRVPIEVVQIALHAP